VQYRFKWEIAIIKRAVSRFHVSARKLLADLVSGQLPDEVESLAASPDAWVGR
jgi:hypothetical protein